MSSNLHLSNKLFLETIKKQHKDSSKPFCWILGSGASVSSGIPLGRELTAQWLNEMYNDLPTPKPSLKEWANIEFKNIPGFTYETATNFYPYVYQRRFSKAPEDGIKFLENFLAQVKPALGYVVLSQLMTLTRHNLAVTTNFDNIIQDTITRYSTTSPLLCDSKSLAQPIINTLKRPIIAKIHPELLTTSFRTVNDIVNSSKEWQQPLSVIFEKYTPIIIGFGDLGGTGGSLIRFINELSPSKNGMLWCYREKKNAKPAEEIISVVSHHGGSMVPIIDFDSFLFQIWESLNMVTPNDFHKDFLLIIAKLLALENTNMSETEKSAVESAKSALEKIAGDSV